MGKKIPPMIAKTVEKCLRKKNTAILQKKESKSSE